MPLTLMYVTNDPAVALIAERSGVDWIFVFSTLEASSFRYIAMQYPPSPKNTPWPSDRMPA